MRVRAHYAYVQKKDWHVWPTFKLLFFRFRIKNNKCNS